MKKFAIFCIFLFFLWIHAYFRGILWRIREFLGRFFPFFWGIMEVSGANQGIFRVFWGTFFYLAAFLKRKLEFLGKIWTFGDIFFCACCESWNFLPRIWSFSDIFFGTWGESWNFLQEFELLWWVLISFWCVTDSFKGFFELLEIIFSVPGAKVGILGVDLNFKGEFLGNLNWKLDFFAGIWTLGSGVLFF